MSPSQVAPGHVALPSQGYCIHTLFEQQVQRTPHGIALITETAEITYQQLNHQANCLAHQLVMLGMGADSLVGLCVERSLDMVVGILGILKAGAAYVPIDPNYPTDRIKFILQDTQVKILLTQAPIEATLQKCLPSGNTELLCLDRDLQLTEQVCPNPEILVNVDHLMYVIYTSGSTGAPKGVMISHNGICNQISWRQATFPLNQPDRLLQTISLSFDPSVTQILWPLLVGAQLVLAKPGGQLDIAYLIETIIHQEISVIGVVPSLLRVFLEQPKLDQCPTLKHVFCGGEALPLELQKQFFKRFSSGLVYLHNVYGPTEASIEATYWACSPTDDSPVAPIGYPLDNVAVHILDDALNSVQPGEIGEIYIGGIGLARGYLNQPELTAKQFIIHPITQHRLYRTQDLGKYLPNGAIQFIGRIDQQVKIRGFRIELGEIESHLDQHPDIIQSAVVAWEFAPGQKRLYAYIVSSIENLKVNSLRSWLQNQLPDYMVPAMYMFLDALPLNANGKVDRHTLPTPICEYTYVSDDEAYIQDPWTRKLTTLWCEVLRLPSINQDDSFFELGGDSLLAAQLSINIEKTFKQPFPISNFFKAPTLYQMASLIKEKTGDNPGEVIVPIQPHGNKQPLFCFHTKSGSVFDYYGLAKYLGVDQPIYGVQSRGFDSGKVYHERIETMAADYLNEIQSVQPHGPYYLCGYSFGGLLAYEIAQRLTAQGEAVGLLALVDAYNYPGDWFTEPLSVWMQNTMTKISHFSWKERVHYGQQKLTALGQFCRRTLTHQPTSYDKISLQERISGNALIQYRAAPYGGDLILFRADQTPEPHGYRSVPRAPSLGWDKMVTGTIAIHSVSGHHFILMDEPHIQTLAQTLSTHLHTSHANG
ncbi:non-ribosomal peptide synthetase [Leptothoe sp. PORK10 BA2]|uniref:non-ribosomal peptide synthetase n=1 Tax=Leptothoe sp. PORK10 BA2 TaxID=3110254 RepID=UPI002B1F22A0|nr:amino acid adenylation domain-containing protein [Leptothoe sp. PORK10 BA2]MEA5464330.1 amino acid adenylation domain-containing protein [Leptothoe sp. PORK10 BA2]